MAYYYYVAAAARRAPWVVVYLVAGLGVLINLLGESLSNAAAVCELYPHFSFYETLLEELTMHHTRLPLVRVHVPTLHLLGGYMVVYAVKSCGLLDRGWPLLLDVLSGRWLYHQLVEVLPSYLPFTFTEPDVPALLSEEEDRDVEDDEDFDDVPPVDQAACKEALAKLVQVKMQHANRTIPRPDDWLVFDPVQEKLVLQKHVNGSLSNGHVNDQAAGSKVSLPREQEPIGNNQQPLLPAADAEHSAKRVEVATDVAMNQPQDAATGVRKRF